MSVVEEISRLLLILLIAMFLLQVLAKGNGTNWLFSFISNTSDKPPNGKNWTNK